MAPNSRWSGELKEQGAVAQPGHWRRRPRQPCFLQQRIVGALDQPHYHLVLLDFHAPVVATNFRNSLSGLALSKPFSRRASSRYSRSAATVSVKSKSTFRRTSLLRQSRWKKVICSPSPPSTRFLCAYACTTARAVCRSGRSLLKKYVGVSRPR